MNLYETDFYAWTRHQAQALKQHQWESLDIPNLLEEIEALGSFGDFAGTFTQMAVSVRIKRK
jgi:hypothetical protein